MRSFWFGTRVALLFLGLVALVLGAALALFARVAAPELEGEISRARAMDLVAVADVLERTLAAADGEISSEAMRQRVHREEVERDLRLAVTTSLPARQRAPSHWPWRYQTHSGRFELQGRTIWQAGAPSFVLWTRLHHDGRAVAFLRLAGPNHAVVVHKAFARGILHIAFLALVAVVVLTVVLTAPLRRMSRSMDRVAAGELDHRVTARGRDEVANMGRSFNAMADRIQEMVRGQQEMLAGVSHELRSPLARMKVTLELMRGAGDRSADGARHLAMLEQEVDHIDDLVGEILTASRLELATAPLRREAVALRPAITAAWQRDQRTATAAGEDPACELDLQLESPTARVMADPDLLARILDNLLANARRYARQRVAVSTHRDADRVVVEVADDGPGAEAPLDRLFEPFYRADPSRGHSRHVGLGLAIVRRAVQSHGGRVTAASSRLGGLAVRFDLPAE